MDSTGARLHFLKRVFGSRSTAGRVATPQDLSVTKQHRNDRWDRCTESAGDWQIITTTRHRSANQRYFMHNSATVHRMRMQSLALDSSRSQLCNDTSTGVVRHQITKWRRLQKVVSYDVLHHMNFEWCFLRQDPLDLSFWSFFTFLHHGIEKVERHLLWKFHKKIQRKRWSNVPPNLLACIRFLYKVVHKIGRLRKFNRARKIEFNFFTA